MTCAICLFVREAPEEAITVLNGQAVCEDHVGYVQGEPHSTAINQAKRDETR